MGSFYSKNDENDENDECVGIKASVVPDEYIMTIQHTRKMMMLKQFNEYIKNIDKSSVYYKHYINTKEIESVNGITREFKVRYIFYMMHSVDITLYRSSTYDWIN